MFVYDISTRFSVSTLLYRSLPLDRALDAIAQTDFTYVDLWAVPGVLAHVDPRQDDSAVIEAKLTERGLRAASVTAYQTAADDLIAAMDFAGAIGARTVITDAPPREADRRDAADDSRALGRAALEAGVTLCLANRAGTWMDTAAEIASFLDDVGHPRVQISFGPPHAVVANVSLHALADAAGNRIGQAYLWSLAAGATTPDEFGDGDAQTPGNGSIDLGELMGLLEERNYNGLFTFMWHGTEDWSLERIGAALAAARAHVLEASRTG